ncbi:hypothetical protein DRN43_02330 [Thermococci archaeon]|nr:MAG: hypothetical protein DRJ03_12605 [Chloroflexota bacterium]RLF90154.1 MAG: hypothetical protein DRN43_02330 [Thermococci archaeon]
MGLREWLLKPYLHRLQALEAQVQDINKKLDTLRAEILELHKNKADKDRLSLIERELESIENLNRYLFDIVKELRTCVYAEIEGSGSEPRENQQTLEEALIELIKQGYDSPKKLARKAQIGVGRMYEILERLEKENRIRTIKKGRKKKIIVIED